MKELNILTIDGEQYSPVDETARSSIGTMSDLETEATTLVGAVNEVKGDIPDIIESNYNSDTLTVKLDNLDDSGISVNLHSFSKAPIDINFLGINNTYFKKFTNRGSFVLSSCSAGNVTVSITDDSDDNWYYGYSIATNDPYAKGICVLIVDNTNPTGTINSISGYGGSWDLTKVVGDDYTMYAYMCGASSYTYKYNNITFVGETPEKLPQSSYWGPSTSDYQNCVHKEISSSISGTDIYLTKDATSNDITIISLETTQYTLNGETITMTAGTDNKYYYNVISASGYSSCSCKTHTAGLDIDDIYALFVDELGLKFNYLQLNDTIYTVADSVARTKLDNTEDWVFTLMNGTTVTKKVVIKNES